MERFFCVFFISLQSSLASALPPELPAFKFEVKSCQSESADHGQAERMAFTDLQYSCGDLKVQLEVKQPVTPELVDRQVTNEMIMVQESYSAMRNPYAGFISDTAQCPTKNNFARDSFKFNGKQRPLLLGRMTERGAWGACGQANDDFWGAITFMSSRDALMKIKITAKKKLSKAVFNSQVLALLRAITVR